jgi:hypothetical protein
MGEVNGRLWNIKVIVILLSRQCKCENRTLFHGKFKLPGLYLPSRDQGRRSFLTISKPKDFVSCDLTSLQATFRITQLVKSSRSSRIFCECVLFSVYPAEPNQRKILYRQYF